MKGFPLFLNGKTRRQAGRTVSLGVEYSRDELGGGFYRSKTMPDMYGRDQG
ncbi:Error-prone lesion bypass DNA polymerase V (UmuC) [Bacillus paralicheniformis]|nr:Error-prone lesion bypass DNA polymerase V (UmuC) [Bacillus paralicheniformis]